MTIFLLIILSLLLLVFLIDAIPQFYTWQSRIKIGRFTDKNIWKDKVLKKSIFWLNHLPKMKIKDQERLIIIDILKGDFYRNTLQSWQEASLLLGLNTAYEKTKNAEIKKEISIFLERKLHENGTFKNSPKEIDVALLSYAISEVSFIDQKKIKPLFDETYQIIKNHLKEDGTVAYRNYSPNYRLVDTIGFICPFLTKYGVKYNDETAINLAISQIKNFEKFGLLENKIPVHAYQVNTKNPVGIFGWGRGLAWFLIGVLETIKQLPKNHAEKQNLLDLVHSIAENLKNYQKQDGSFSWNIFDDAAQKDSSATAVFAWFFKEIGFENEAQKSLQYLKSVTKRTGEIDFSQGDTKAIGIYSQNFGILPFTQGFALRILF